MSGHLPKYWMRLSDIEEKERLTLPTIEVGDEILVGKFKNRKATVIGFAKDDHNQPILKTTKGDQKLFKPRLTKLMVTEGLIAIPPKMAEHIDFLLTYHVLWWARDRFKGKIKELPEQYSAFQNLIREFGEQIPNQPYHLPKKVSVTSIPVSLDGMPPNYLHLHAKTDHIFFAIDWRVTNTLGGWRPTKDALIVYPLALDYLVRYPTERSHPDDLRIALDTLRETISHELRHMVQYVILQNSKQIKLNPGYEKHGSEYFTSPVEFDPTIGSTVQEFMQMWEIYGETNGKMPLEKAVKMFVGAVPSDRFGPFSTPKFFIHLKHTPVRYKAAVKKFIIALRDRLKITDSHSSF